MADYRKIGKGITGALAKAREAAQAQKDLRVYHGSPHRMAPTPDNPLGKFDSSKAGTGEGGSAYGIGHYLAQAKDVAKTYRPRSPRYEEKLIKEYNVAQAKKNYPKMEVLEDAMLHKSPDEILAKYSNIEDGYTPEHAKAANEYLKWLEKNKPEVGGLYHVDLPKDSIANMLDWDKPMKNHPPQIKKMLDDWQWSQIEAEAAKRNMSPYDFEKEVSMTGRLPPTTGGGISGDQYYSALAEYLGGRDKASKALQEMGIPGIKYYDEASRPMGGWEVGKSSDGKWLLKNHELSSNQWKEFPNEQEAISAYNAIPDTGTRNFVVFHGNEDMAKIVDREKKGGVIHMADAGKVVRGGLSAVRMASKAADEAVAAGKLSHSGDTALPLMLPRANPSSDFINQQAERVARQMLGEHVVSGKPKKTANLAGRSAQESRRVKGLNYKLSPTGTVAQEVPYAPRRGDLKVAVPGDQTVSNKILDEVNGFPIDSVQEGGAYYGLGQRHLADPEFWKSNEEPAKRMQSKVDRVAELYEPDRVIGTHLAMGPRSNNFAMHFADANLRAVDWAKAEPKKIEIFDSIIAYGYKDPKTKEMVKFPNWPGLADREGALAAMKEDPNLRKWFNDRMKTPKLTKPLGLPNGLDIQYAISEPNIRDMEINMTGLMTGELQPGALVEAAGAPHNTYSHRILGKAGGPQEVLTPFVIDFPDAAQHIASTKSPADFTGTIQKVFPHQLVDDQYLNQYGEYRDRIKALTGQKKGGAVTSKESPEDMDRFNKLVTLHKADGGKIVKGLMGAFSKASKMADEKIAADAIGKAAESAGMKAPVTANKPLTNLQDVYTSLGDKVNQGAVEMQNLIESMPYKYDKGQRVFTADSVKKNKPPYTILRRVPYGNQPMREDHPNLQPGNKIGKPIIDPATGKTQRTPYEPGYHVRHDGGDGWTEFQIPESAIKGDVEMARGGRVEESPEDMARFNKLIAMHKAMGGMIKKFDVGGPASGGAAFGIYPKAKGGEDLRSGGDYAGEFAKALGKITKDQSSEEASSLKKPRAATDLLNRGVLANNPLSAMVDLVNMGLVPLDVLGSKLTGRDIKVSSDKPFLGSEYVKDLMNKYNVTSGEERPMMETALSFASPAGMIKGAMKTADLAKKAPEALDTVRGGLETMSADAQRPFRSATLTMEGVAPDLGQKGGDKFKDLITKRMISGEGAPVSMERMGGRKTEKTMGQGLYENFAKQLETNPMVGVTIPRAGNLSTNKRLIADIGTAGRELGQEMVAAHKFTPLMFKNPKDATAMMIGGSEPLTKDQIRDIYKLLPGMIVTHSPKNNSVFVAPFEGDALDYKKAAQAANEILGKGAKVQFGKADSTKDIMYRGDYDKMEARPPSAESTEMRNRLKKAEARIVRGPSVSQSGRQSPPSTLTSTVR